MLVFLKAGNESCPQPQTSEHLAAIEIMKLKHIIILQNKIDLVKESQAKEQYDQILKFVQGQILHQYLHQELELAVAYLPVDIKGALLWLNGLKNLSYIFQFCCLQSVSIFSILTILVPLWFIIFLAFFNLCNRPFATNNHMVQNPPC